MDYNSLKVRLNFNNGEVFSIGRSVLGKEIFAIEFDYGKKETIIVQAAIHAREHITSDLCLLLAKKLDYNFSKFKGKIPNIIFVPLANPDGAEIVTCGTKNLTNARAEFIKNLLGEEDFKLYKSNARGVDLNNNFNAKFKTDPAYKDKPASSGFPGYFFESEPETRALARLARVKKTIFTISLHSKGEEIYFNFNLDKKKVKAHKKVANIFQNMLKYNLVDKPSYSAGGFKDYCVLELKIPSITIEVGRDDLTHPLSSVNLQEIAVKFKNFLDALVKTNKLINKIGLEKF